MLMLFEGVLELDGPALGLLDVAGLLLVVGVFPAVGVTTLMGEELGALGKTTLWHVKSAGFPEDVSAASKKKLGNSRAIHKIV